MKRCQVAIIGGGLAGSACAIELKRAGVDVLTFDRDAFPRPKVCGEFLSPGALRSLGDLGVLHQVRGAGAVEVDRARIDWPTGQAEILFDEPGLGFSRERLDWILSGAAGVRIRHSVEKVQAHMGSFRIRVTGPDSIRMDVQCDVIIDAAGRLSRFTSRSSRPQYGVAFHTPGAENEALSFGFFKGGYGGSVAVEGGRTNTCFLVDKARVRDYLSQEGCLVTGPVGYRKIRGPYLAIGDAGGMIDPFTGEGMRLAMESGRVAARIVSPGLERGLSYAAMCQQYESEWGRSLGRKKAVASTLRAILARPATRNMASSLCSRFPASAAVLLRQLWS